MAQRHVQGAAGASIVPGPASGESKWDERNEDNTAQGERLLPPIISDVKAPQVPKYWKWLSRFPKKILVTNRDVGESPEGDSRSVRDRVREPIGQLPRQTR